ncbi:hypothetical protein HYV85_03510 [Candidatus Woesearchaeota archaeon]|nr:hypothetical protein [Candidatus Woesearchaeota archaeon]
MVNVTRSHRLTGSEKGNYTSALDSALEVLANGLAELPEQHPGQFRAFGERNKWDWDRLPKEQNTYQTLADMVRRVQQEYRWFMPVLDSEAPEHNRAYFEEVEVSAESGLPWVWEFIRLASLKRDAPQLLQVMPTYQRAVQTFRSLLLEDYVKPEEVPERVEALHRDALRRSFIEQLRGAELLDWHQGKNSSPVKARKLLTLGAEQLWNITVIKYSAASSLFHLYAIDAWQDVREPVFNEVAAGNVSISPSFEAQFEFGTQNEAWYMLRQIDQAFRSLHPVHVSRAIVGPFEGRYSTSPREIPMLPVTKQLLAEDFGVKLFRFSRQYAFAPNHVEVLGEPQQVVHREDWRDEVIVCPAKYASQVASSVAGTNIKIFKM